MYIDVLKFLQVVVVPVEDSGEGVTEVEEEAVVEEEEETEVPLLRLVVAVEVEPAEEAAEEAVVAVEVE